VIVRLDAELDRHALPVADHKVPEGKSTDPSLPYVLANRLQPQQSESLTALEACGSIAIGQTGLGRL
jgi:hypothetical protein